MAIRAASTARFSPVARPMPMSAEPASFMIARTSAKSWLMRPGTVMMSLMPWTPWRRTSSTTRKASRMLVFFWTTSLSRSLGIVMSASTWALSSSAAFSATSLRLLPSNANGLVTTPIVSAPPSLAICATTGAAPEPVPPPSPAVMKTMSESRERLGDLLGVLLGRALADRRVAAGAEPAGDLVADPDLVRRVRLEERLRIRVAGDELDAHHLGPDHPVDRIAPATPDPDDADQREVLGVGAQRHRSSSRRPSAGVDAFSRPDPDDSWGRAGVLWIGSEYSADPADADKPPSTAPGRREARLRCGPAPPGAGGVRASPAYGKMLRRASRSRPSPPPPARTRSAAARPR